MKRHIPILRIAIIFIVCIISMQVSKCRAGTPPFQVNTSDACNRWRLVTDENQLAVGDKIVITNENATLALSTSHYQNIYGQWSITSENNGQIINIDPNYVQIITLKQGTVPGTFALYVDDIPPVYLYAASSSNDYLSTQTNNNANGSWNITIDNNHNANIIAQGNNTHNIIRYNSSGRLFSCYISGQSPVKIYKLGPPHGDATVTDCGSYTLYGHTFTSSKDTTITLHNAASNGCDSIVTWHVIINEIPTHIYPIPTTICEGDSITLTAFCTSDETLFFSEGFSAITAGSDTSNSSSNSTYSCNLSNFPTCDNNHVYNAGGHLRFGNANFAGGYITSRQIDLSEPYIIKIWVRGWKNNSEHPWFYIKVDNDTVMKQSFHTSSWDAPYMQYNYISTTGATSTSTITIGNTQKKQRFFIDSIAIVSNNTDCRFLWSTGETSSSITVSPSQDTSYYVTITSSEGCPQVNILQLTVSNLPETTAYASADTVTCGDSVTLYVGFIPPIAIGDILCTDGSIVKPSKWPVEGKTAMGIIFYVDTTGEHGWAVHLQDQGSNIQWMPNGLSSDISSLNNYTIPRNAIHDVDGYANTQRIRSEGDASTYPAAYAVDFPNGWYLPSAGQLRMLYSVIIYLNRSLQRVGGSPFPTEGFYRYWSSTEYDGQNAWTVTYLGRVYNRSKQFSYKVRSVRNF